MSFPPTVFSEAPSPSISILTDALIDEVRGRSAWLKNKQAWKSVFWRVRRVWRVRTKPSPARLAIALYLEAALFAVEGHLFGWKLHHYAVTEPLVMNSFGQFVVSSSLSLVIRNCLKPSCDQLQNNATNLCTFMVRVEGLVLLVCGRQERVL